MQTGWIKTSNLVKAKDNPENLHKTENEEAKHSEHRITCHFVF